MALSALTLVGAAAALALEPASSGGGEQLPTAGVSGIDALAIPKGADGIAVTVYGRLFVTTKTGFHIHGLTVGTATLSPGASYVAAGIGNSITELAPGGGRLWSRPVGRPVANCGACSSVAAIAWSPDGSRIAYLVRTPKNAWNQVLHVVRRDGTHDIVIARNARGGHVSWRSDSRALAYLGAHGRPVVYDLAHGSHHVITWSITRSPAPDTQLAFAPRGSELAIATETTAVLVGEGRQEIVFRGQPQAVSWLGGRLAVSERLTPSGRSKTQLFTVSRSGATLNRTIRLGFPIYAARGRTVSLPSYSARFGHVLAGPLGSLRTVFRFRLKPGPAGCACGYIPIGDRDISIG